MGRDLLCGLSGNVRKGRSDGSLPEGLLRRSYLKDVRLMRAWLSLISALCYAEWMRRLGAA